jgi:glycosyltransferase involved in cell wall biosynthesis/predicted SAM-dependent methyltransferase
MMTAAEPIRLTVVMTHPVQYATPWFRYIAEHCPEIRLEVLYATQPTPEQQGVGFGCPFSWDLPLTEGYRSRIVRQPTPEAQVQSDRFWGVDVPEISTAIAATHSDVVLIPGWHSVTLLRALWACRRRRIPVLYRGDSNLGGMPSGWRGNIWVARTWTILRAFDGYLSVGARAREYLRRFSVPAARVFDAPHCVDNDFFAAAAAPHQGAAARRAVRQTLGLDARRFVVLFVGKLEDKKRPLDVISALAAVQGDTQLLMVGAGPLAVTCQAEAQRLGVHAAWPGFLNQSELGKIYAVADCLVLPSDARETWGLVVNEALAAGVPCVVSDHVGCALDLVTPGVTGEIFPMGDVGELAAALQRMSERCAAGQDFATACRARAAQYSLATATAGLLQACRATRRRVNDAPPQPATATLKQRVGRWLFAHMPITRFLFDQLRVEVNAALTWLANGLLPWRRQRLAALRRRRALRVNVACGPHVLPGFVNLDLRPCSPEVIGWDCRRRLPLATESADGIRVEHFLEHLEPREELPAFLADCVRVLRPGGVLRVIVPDAERYLQAYCRSDLSGFRELAVPDPFPDDLPTRMDIINHVFHQWQEHRWGYDFETLAQRLRCAGFERVERTAYGASLDPQLAQDRESHAAHSLYVDATKSTVRGALLH